MKKAYEDTAFEVAKKLGNMGIATKEAAGRLYNLFRKIQNQSPRCIMKKAFTLVELLTVVAIIVLLIGMVMPASFVVRRYAKETKQKAQIMTIGLGLTTFRNDYGDYPPSDEYSDSPDITYCGAQKLSEALLGWDLLGFHPDSAFGGNETDIYNTDTLDKRKGHYLEIGTANAFRLGITADYDGLFADTSFGGTQLRPDTFVICDVFGIKKINLLPKIELPKTKIVKAGTPILYYRANTASKNINNAPPDFPNRIYNYYDNVALVGLNKLADSTKFHRLANSDYFYDEYIVDFKVTSMPWPHRPDSYILISAGMDGEYGTADDITNF